MSSTTDHFDNDFSTASKKIPRYSAELGRQIEDRFITLYDFHGTFVHGVVKLSFSHKFLSYQWLPYVSINMISTHSWCEREGNGCLLRDSAQAFSNVLFQPIKEECILEQVIDVAANTQRPLDFIKFIANICEQTTNFFSLTKVLFGLLNFFRKACLKLGVWLIHKCDLYTSLYGITCFCEEVSMRYEEKEISDSRKRNE